MANLGLEKLGAYVEDWVRTAPSINDVDNVTHDAMDALVEANMVQYKAGGWDFKLHEKHPDAPRAEFKLMIREAPRVDTNPAYYDRFTLSSVLQAGEAGLLNGVNYVLGYPNAGKAIASAFARLAIVHLGIELAQLEQGKITHADGSRELGDIISAHEEGASVFAVDDTTTGGDTKIEGWRKIAQHGLSYAGLALIVERDPLGSALVRERTSAGVYPSIHWLTLAQYAVQALELPNEAIQRELTYPTRLYEWNVANNNLGSLPDPDLISLPT